MKRHWYFTALLGCSISSACSDGDPAGDSGKALQILKDGGIEQIAFISRPARLEVGDVFQYTSFSVEPKSANIMRLGSLSGGAKAEAVTPFGSGDWPKADIMWMDVSFDGEEIVFSARLDEAGAHYNIYRIKIDGTNPEEPGETGPALIHAGPYDAVYPTYLPNDKIFFMTNEPPEPGIKQFVDEYERGQTSQGATIDKHGAGLHFGPRNLSHRVFPTMVSLGEENRGQVMFTNWDHLNRVNEGNLMVMNPDMTGTAEFFGKEGSSQWNSTIKGRQVNPDQFLAIATARERTFQAGGIVLITRGKNERESAAEVLTMDVPLGREPSYEGVGRFYDAYPVTDASGQLTHVLTSWANGPVNSDIAAGGVNEEGVDYGAGSGPPDFGIYVLDPASGTQLPIFNDEEMWDVLPLAIGNKRKRPTSPAGIATQTPDGTAMIGALNVLESSLAGAPSGDIHRVRVIEGFSAEEGIPDDFGLTEADGAILLGEAPVQSATDNSFAAFVPEDRPIHLQLVDGYGLSALNEDRWFSSGAGEQRFCGGCHEERGGTAVVDPGLSDAIGAGAANLGLPYAERALPDAANKRYADMVAKVIWPDLPTFAPVDRIRGVPWDIGVQQVFEPIAAGGAGCVECHNGQPGPANPTVVIRDTMSPMSDMGTEWTFDLSGEAIDFTYGMMTGNYTKSHISLLLLAGMMNEEGVEVEIDPAQPYQMYVEPESARDSVLIRYVQPERVYPVHDANDLAFADTLKANGQPYEAQHPNANTPGYDAALHRPLTTQEKYLLILMADLGGQYYALENAPGQSYARKGGQP